MRVIQVMFDTLSKDYLPNYGNDWVIAPNFKRLEKHCCRFDECYGGSMPCMPARRELHTGQYNFLHRSWGPLEPFDFSVFEELKKNNIYTHLVSDHSHYWEDGGATYHNRYNTWEGFRGQEGDRYLPHDGSIQVKQLKCSPLSKEGVSVDQHYANMTEQQEETKYSSVKTFEAGLKFINNHIERDNWFLQIETFDPHEPYTVPNTYRDMYDLPSVPYFNWSAYQEIDTMKHTEEISMIRREYAALLTMCDHYLGKVLDMMDAHDMWKDTVLIVNTDHGFLLGEHEFIGKNMPPMYEELIHIPLFIHVPSVQPKSIATLCQTIDIPATLLELFNLQKPKDMMGSSLLPTLVQDDIILHEDILFGVFGSYVCYYDGTNTFMKAPNIEKKAPLFQYTLMPTKARGFIETKYLKDMKLVHTDIYSHGLAVLQIPCGEPKICGYEGAEVQDILFHVKKDSMQKCPVVDEEILRIYKQKLAHKLNEVQAPQEVFDRLGLSS